MISPQNVKQHLFIIITLVIGFSSFIIGFSFSPFLEVGFRDSQVVESGTNAGSDADLMKHYEDLYSTEDEKGDVQ